MQSGEKPFLLGQEWDISDKRGDIMVRPLGIEAQSC